MQWYYSKNGTQLGPVGEGELRSKLTSGEISPSDLVWKDGMTDWLPSSKVPSLASTQQVEIIESSAIPVSETLPNSAAPYQAPAHANYQVAPPAGSGKATAAMVLGIVGLVFGICGCYGIMIALPCCILAIIFGGQVKKEAIQNPALGPELGKAKAGVIMGWIGLSISILFTIGLMAFGVATGVMSEMNK
jgi:GYF domain 2